MQFGVLFSPIVIVHYIIVYIENVVYNTGIGHKGFDD